MKYDESMEYDELGNPARANNPGYQHLRRVMWEASNRDRQRKRQRQAYVPSDQREGFETVEIEQLPSFNAKPVKPAHVKYGDGQDAVLGWLK